MGGGETGSTEKREGERGGVGREREIDRVSSGICERVGDVLLGQFGLENYTLTL